jgi:tRNA (cmo5U34)-methyltransferase
VSQPGCRLVAVDSSAAMIGRCRQLLGRDVHDTPVELMQADIRDCEIAEASVVVLNFTLQFIPPAERTGLLQRIYDGLRPGGVLLLSEKVVFAEPTHNERMTALYYDFKRANGYSELEISQKRTALENVLVPETVAQHQQRAWAVGFASCELWFQALNFVSLLAIKA